MLVSLFRCNLSWSVTHISPWYFHMLIILCVSIIYESYSIQFFGLTTSSAANSVFTKWSICLNKSLEIVSLSIDFWNIFCNFKKFWKNFQNSNSRKISRANQNLSWINLFMVLSLMWFTKIGEYWRWSWNDPPHEVCVSRIIVFTRVIMYTTMNTCNN